MTNKEIQNRLKELSSDVKKFQESIIPGSKKILGVRVPDLRILAKEIAKDDYKKFLDTNKRETWEDDMLCAMVIGYAKDDINEILKELEKFIPTVQDWAVNDALCQTFKIAKKYPKEVYKFLMKYKKSKDEFTVRVVIVMLLSHFMTDEYIDDVINVLNNIYAKDYYAQMALAWGVCEIAIKFPDKCYEYMTSKDNKLDNFTYNKAISKMQDSFRVSNEMKEKMKKLRK